MKKLNWEHVTAFDKDGNAHHFAVHVTQKGEPNKRDVKRILAEGCRIPLRYSDGGIRLLNPALPWPEEVLLSGDPPEVYARLGEEFVAQLRTNLLLHHPAKMTQSDKEELGRLERLISGEECPETEDYVQQREALLAAIALQDVTVDEW